MKHTWDSDYIERKYGIREANHWANRKKSALETKHGCPFSWYTAHGKFCFSVTPNFSEISPVNAPSLSAELLSLLSKARSFIWLKEHLGETTWTWDVLFSVCKHLITTQQIHIVVDRMGKACGISK